MSGGGACTCTLTQPHSHTHLHTLSHPHSPFRERVCSSSPSFCQRFELQTQLGTSLPGNPHKAGASLAWAPVPMPQHMQQRGVGRLGRSGPSCAVSAHSLQHQGHQSPGNEYPGCPASGQAPPRRLSARQEPEAGDAAWGPGVLGEAGHPRVQGFTRTHPAHSLESEKM